MIGVKAARLRHQFLAWWEGYDLSTWENLHGCPHEGEVEEGLQPLPEVDDSTAKAIAEATEKEPKGKDGRPLWSAVRVEVVEKLWGEGATLPGGEACELDLLKLLNLHRENSLLHINPGLAGACFAATKKFGHYVTALEPSPLLLTLAIDRAKRRKLDAKIEFWPLEGGVSQLPRRHDAIFARDVFYTIEDKPALLAALRDNLKPRGKMMFTDYVVISDGKLDELGEWMAGEPVPVYPWSCGRYSDELEALNLNVRVDEDITAKHLEHLAHGLESFQRFIAARRLAPHTKKAVQDEIALWAGRLHALSKGLRLYRYFCIPAEDA